MRQTTDFHALSTLCVGTESTLRDMSVNGTFGRRTTVVITEQNKYEYRIQFVIIKYRTKKKGIVYNSYVAKLKIAILSLFTNEILCPNVKTLLQIALGVYLDKFCIYFILNIIFIY